jgi:hypothetical protein
MTVLNSCSSIPMLQLMHCLKSVRPLFQLFCHSMNTCHRQTLPVSRNFVTPRCNAVLLGTSLSGYALLNASRTAANDFYAKFCSRMNTRSAREYTMFALAWLLRTWREQRPGNQGEYDSSVTGKVGRVCYTGGEPASDFIFAPQDVADVGLCFKWHTLSKLMYQILILAFVPN